MSKRERDALAQRMAAKPERPICAKCGKHTPLRKNGTFREHYVYRPQAEQDPTVPLGRVRTCPGSGLRPDQNEGRTE